ncbi:LOW QUALITY PROTEIN: tyrosine-protein phosphatase Lar-like [Babylonia areolata]|uniref:LOW QUALITY PROTEIN: tyrosine-protein phosphatase Lar-like n=1 Tax=Babylonia areolata TaxID=304850 RepID=UPI003FD40D4B
MAKPAGPCDVTMGFLLTVTKPLLPLLPLLLLLHPASTVTDVPPRIIEAPISQKVADMGKVSFVCRASGHPAPTFHWERNRKRLTKNRNRYKVVEAPQMSVLRIEPVRGKRDHNMVISCVADNGLGQARAEATLTVYVKDNGKAYPHGYPLITAHPKLKSVEKGLSTLLQCETSGNPAPVVTWFKDMLPLDFSDPRITLLSNGYLQIQNSQESDEATYECVAHNDLGVTYSYPAMMYVKVRRVPPRFIKEMANDVTAMPGSDVNLTCVAVGSPMPEVRWRHGAEVLTPEGAVPVGRNVLELRDVRQSANYTCEASSDLGNIEHVVTLRLQAPGSAPRDLRAFAASATTVELSWKPPQIPNDVIQGYRVFYTLQPESPVVFWEQKKVGAGQHKTTLSQLAPNVTYTIAVLAFSPSGPGPLSHPLQVLTKRGVPFQPLSLRADPATPNELRVSWLAPHQADSLSSYELYYNDSHTRQNVRLSIQPPVNSYRLQDLTPDTVYRLQVAARSARGEGPRTPPITARTLPFVPGEPRRLRVEAINSTGLFAEWEAPKDGPGLIRGYRLYFRPVNVTTELPLAGHPESCHDTESGEVKEAVVTGLEADTWYTLRVAAYTRKGDGARSKPRILNTKGAVPTPPRNLHVHLVRQQPPRVKVTWQRPRKTFGALENYKIIWGPQGESYEEKIMSPHIYSFLTKTLDRGTTYEFRVSAKNGVDYGERAVVTIETPEGAPSGTPQNFSGTGLTESSVRLQWDPPARPLQNGRIMQYQLTYRRVSDGLQDQRQVNVTDTWAKLTSLDSNTDYIVQIRAFTARGGGPWSNRLHFRTFGNMPSAPKQVSVRRTSPTSVEVTWEEVGDGVAGYRVFYNTFSTQAMDAWQYLDTGPYTVLDLTGLDPHTVYAVRVQARSVDGRYGNLSETVTTDVIEIERDDMVQNFRVTSRLTNVVRLAWSPPKKENVSIYLLRYSGLKTYREAGQTKVVLHEPEEVRIPGQKTSWTVKKLQPKMRLVFNITAFFPKSDTMGPVAHVVTETLIDAPPRVEAPVVEEREGVTIQLRLRPASERNGPLSHYHLVVVPRKARPFGTLPSDFTVEELMNEGTGPDQPYIAARFEAHALLPYFLLGDGQEYGAFFNRPLLSDRTYRVFLRAYSVDQRLYTSSPYSEHLSVSPAHRQSPAGGGNPHSPPPPHAPGRKGGRGRGKGRAGGVSGTRRQEPSPGPLKDSDMLLTIVAPTCSLALLLLCGAALAVYCRMRRGRHSKSVLLEEEERRGLVMEVPPCVADPVQMRRQHYQTAAMMSHPPVPVERLAEHINLLKAAENLRFSQEYESIDPGQQFTWESSSLEVNKAKNRYANVIAYDHSRVVLAEVKGVAGSDYINANYNDGYRKHNAYIATQGPLPETFGDFWRMVWEQRSTTVVMMTRLQERSRIKCDQYWPSRGAETYGLMHVQLLDVTELAIYTVRLFQLSKLGSTEKREVRQFQFTAWPDHGVPDHPTPLLLFLRRVKASLPTESGPLVVHCSAGVGRTGAFIVIDAMLERLRHEKTVDVYGHVTCLRAQRNYMVQTEEQYMFIHDAVLEAVQCTHTDIPARLLANHVTGLTQPLPGHTLCPMELEFQRLSNMKASPNRFVSANLPVNKFKNRLVNILPYETTRVCLQPIRGVDGSDYINASYIDGYRYKKAYIATQGPLAETREDLWRMLWEQNSCIIVNLTKLREMGREMCQQYWPTDRSARYQYFVVDPMTEYNMPHYILREFKVTDARDGQSRTIRQFHFTDWPEQGVPKCGEAFIDFIGQVHKTKEQFGHEGPITVHCSAGVGRTGVFIALSIVLDRMRAEGLVDLVHTVKMLRTQRPAMVHTQDQFQFCYRAALEYLGSFDHYAH